MNTIEEARSWLGTKFKKNASCKGVGADCIGLISGVYIETTNKLATKNTLIKKKIKKSKIITNLLQKDVDSHLLMLYNQFPEHKNMLNLLLANTEKVNQISNGSVGIFVFDHQQPHLGLIAKNRERLTLIHAHEASGKVVEHRLYGEMLSKLKHIYNFL